MDARWKAGMGLATVALLLSTISPAASGRVAPVTGDYEGALKIAGEQGKPLMVYVYTDWCGYCRKMNGQIDQIPETISKYAFYPVNAERKKDLAKQLNVRGFPTTVILKPDGTEVHRWSGAYPDQKDLQQALEGILAKAGPIDRQPPANNPSPPARVASATPAQETAAGNELKLAELSLKSGKIEDARRALRNVVQRYPGTRAADEAQQKLNNLGP